MKGYVDADLAAATRDPNTAYALVNLGANDVIALPSQAQWESDLGYILDAFRTKWPSIQVYVMRPWRRGFAAQCDTLAGWIANVVGGGRAAWAHVGPDERVFLENGDDGVTYTTDGTHPNEAGYYLTAVQWKTALGY